MWINWLLKYEGYPPGVVVALLLHGILMWILLPSEFEAANQVRIEPASYVVASAVAQSPQKLRRIEQANQRRADDAARERQRQQQAAAERQRQQQAEAERQRQQQAAAERQRQQQAEREKQQQAEREKQQQAEREKQQQAERERQQQAERERQQQAERERQQAAERERQRQETAQREAAEAAARAAADAAAQQQMSAENQLVAQYVTLIRDLVSGAWNRPPNARNGMVAVVQLRLTPTGEIINSAIMKSSGSPEFDRSVLQAIDRVGSFPELRDMPTAVFERNFRAINLEFSPEDLLR
jgi:colicin import membrane protein